MKIAGLYACCDLSLLQWLMYLPSSKLATDAAAKVDQSEVTVDIGIAQASVPITSPTSQGSLLSCLSQQYHLHHNTQTRARGRTRKCWMGGVEEGLLAGRDFKLLSNVWLL